MKKLITLLLIVASLGARAQSPKMRVEFVDSAGYNQIAAWYLPQVAISGYAKNLIYFGSTSQYVRGDGSLATFPAGYTFTGSSTQYTKGDGTYALFPTTVSTFTNDVPYLASTSTVNELSKTANYTILSTDFAAGKQPIIDLSVDATAGNVTITLPTASSFGGYTIYVTKTDVSANTVTISGLSGTNVLYL